MTQTICFAAQFIKTEAGVGTGVNGLTVTWDIEQITRSDGTRSALVTGGANTIAVGRRGLYGYVLTGVNLLLYDYVATAITAGDVDCQEISGMWTSYNIEYATEIGNMDAAITSRLAAAGYTAPLSAGQTAAAVLDAVAADYDDPATIGEAINDAASAGGATPQTFWTYTGPGGRTLTMTGAQVEAALSGSTLIVYRDATFEATITGLGNLTARDALYVTIKRLGDEDADAIIQIEETGGLLVINREAPAAPVVAADGSLTVDDEADGDVTIRLEARAASYLPILTSLDYDVKIVEGSEARPLVSGKAHIKMTATV